MLRSLLFSLAIVASPSAFAADVPPEAPVATPTGTLADWSGLTIGALLGYRFDEAELSGLTPDGLSLDANGFEGGFFAGANAQYDRFVFGVEGDFAVGGGSATENGVTLDEAWNAAVRGRAGVALDDFLVYGTAGVAAKEVEIRSGGASDDATVLGATIGVGLEKMVTDRVAARVEYRYTEYEDKTFSLGGAPVDVDLDDQTIRAGIGFRF